MRRSSVHPPVRRSAAWKAWTTIALISLAAGWAVSAAQRWRLEGAIHDSLQRAAEREAVGLLQATLTGTDMGAVEISGLFDPDIKTLALQTDVAQSRLLRPGETHLRAIAASMDGDEAFVVNRDKVIIAEWVRLANQQAIGLNLAHRGYVQQALQGRASIFTTLSSLQQQRVLYFAAPIHAGYQQAGDIIGVMVGRKLPDMLYPFLKSDRHQDALLLSPHGVVFAASRQEWEQSLVGPATDERARLLTATRRYAALFKDPSASRLLPFDPDAGPVIALEGRRLARAVVPIEWNDPDGPWRLVLLKDLDLAMSGERQLALAVVAAGLLAGGLALMRQFRASRDAGARQVAAIRARADQLREIFRLAPIGVAVILNRQTEFVNPALAAQLGVSLHGAWPDCAADAGSQALMNQVLAERRELHRAEVRLLDIERRPRDFLLSTMRIDYEGDKPALVLWLVDVTRRRQAAREATRAKEAAEAEAHAKSSFLVSMSHEIRTPMNVIIGMSDLALRTGMDARQRTYLEKANGAAISLLGLIDDLLDLSRMESGRLTLEAAPFDLVQVLDHMVNLIGLRAQDKGVELLLHLPGDVPTALIGDPARLGQVLVNLGNNAVKFTDEGEVIVRVERVAPALPPVGDAAETADDVTLRFSVRDSGIGLSEEACARLFSSFVQADTSTTRKYGGSGLGLAISRQLVERMGGSIGVDSRPGEGATFFFTVRLGLQSEAPAAAAAPVDFSRLRVLVVDDNRAAREILGALCEGFGMRVAYAVNGANAVQSVLEAQAAREPVDLVLMDWHMPVLDGLEAARLIVDGRLETPPAVLLVTAFGRDDALTAALAAFDPHHRPVQLNKPVTASTLLSAIATAKGHAYRPPPPAPRLRATTRQAMLRLAGARLLVVEDDPASQELAAELLRAAGLAVTLAGNGREALDRLATSPAGYDAVLLDCQMPVMDGYETTRQIRRNPAWRELPVIALTASAMLGDRERILAAGMNDHLPKPLNVERLFETLARWLAPAGPEAVADTATEASEMATAAATTARATAEAASPLETLLRDLTRLLQAGDAEAVEIASALLREIDARPPPAAQAQLLRRVAAATAGFAFDEALALLRWDGGAAAARTSR